MPAKTARDIMNREVLTIDENATLHEVAETLSLHHISGAPVVDKSGRVVGIISESDVIDEKKRKSAIPHLALFGLYAVPEKLLEEAYSEGLALRAMNVMSRDVLTADEETPISELAAMMVRKRINRIPILRDGKLVGIVTREDILRGLW
ncbi:MAG: CBS domain-containing protein [Armatimonadetes bacterium]|nr:CBS domain-containing protein [Armatimonadota bacterium]